MNLDERLEALTQSVELMAAMHRDHEKRVKEHFKAAEKHSNAFEEQKRLVTGAIESIAETNRMLSGLAAELHQSQVRLQSEFLRDRKEYQDALMRLSVIAEAHQDTLGDHEKRLRQS